jgi:hypothetical protein
VTKGFYLLALMDMAQNDGDHELLVKLAEKAVNSKENNTLLIERAAQAFWTAGDIERAQQIFSKACLLPLPNDVFRFKWQYSC